MHQIEILCWRERDYKNELLQRVGDIRVFKGARSERSKILILRYGLDAFDDSLISIRIYRFSDMVRSL